MNWKRGLGIGLIFVGFFICLTARVLTGAVIGFSKENYLGLLGVFLLVGGILILSLEKRLKETEYEKEDIIEIMREAGRGKDVVFVIDSSGAIDYEKEIHYLVNYYKDRVYVPKRVLWELEKSKKGGDLIEKEFKDEEGHWKVKQISPEEDKNYKILRRLAKNTLRETKKHKDYLVMRKIVEEDKVPAGVSDKGLEYYQEKIDYELAARLRNKYHKSPTRENKLWLLKKEYRVNKGDVDVLTTALENAFMNKKTKILAHDIHLRDAIGSLRKQYPKLKDNLEYLKYREYAEKEEEIEYASV